MSKKTNIEWAHSTFSPWRGCSKVSPGCANCYIYGTAPLRVAGQKSGSPRIRAGAAAWHEVRRWNAVSGELNGNIRLTERPRIFPSLCDWLDADVPIEWLADFLKLIHDTPNLDWLLLTKRPENWRERMHAANLTSSHPGVNGSDFRNWLRDWFVYDIVPQNIWIGTSVEDQPRADERIPELLKIPGRVRFLSVEPLLGQVDLREHLLPTLENVQKIYRGKEPDYPNIQWIIVGGESGSKARRCNVEWIRDIIKQCRRAKVPVFMKQLGTAAFVDPCPYCGHPEASHQMGRTVGCQHGDGSEANPICGCRKMKGEIKHEVGWPMAFHPIKHPKGGDPAEWPEDLQVREFPKANQ